MARHPKATILVVEDNLLLRQTTATVLEQAGYAVLLAASGKEALEQARLHHPDLILLDVVMPDMSGFEVLRQLRMDWETAEAVIIILSGTRVDEASFERGLLEGADGYLARPISNRVLLAFIQAHLRAKQNERLARAHERQWRDLFENAPLGCLLTTRTAHILFANAPACKLLHLDPEQARGTRLDPVWLEHERLEVYLPESKRTLELLTRPITWNEEAAYPVFLRDLTPLYAAQQALRESEARFRRLTENAADLIYRYDFLPSPHFSYVNPAATAITGYTPEEHYADPDLGIKLIHPEDLPLLESLRAGSVEDLRRPITFRWRHKDGRIIWAEQRNVPVFDEQGRLIAIEGIARDITAQKEAESERARLLDVVQMQRRHLESVLEAIPEGVLVVDAQGGIQMTNSLARDYLQVLVGPAWAEQPLRALGEYPIEALKASPPHPVGWHEIQMRERVFEVRAAPVKNAEMGQTVLVLHDVTRIRQMQCYQQQQERLATVGQLAAGVTHDFNNIMTVVTLYVQATQRLKDLPDEARENLDIVMEEVHHATHLIQQILDFSRRSSLEPQALMLKAFVKEVVKLLERVLPETITVRLHYAGEDDFEVMADPTRLQQALLNLALNARDAMQGRASARLDLRLERIQGPFTCYFCGSTGAGQEWIALHVSDTGSGIPAHVFPHLFEPFFTTKPAGQGNGMGLAQVYGIVKQHGGHLNVQTREGVGSTFTLYLPAHREAQATLAAALQSQGAQGHGQIILVADDHEPVRKAVMQTLWAMNYWTLEASDGRQALELVREHPGIALILCDWVMPKMGGKALLKALQEQNCRIPIIVMSGYPPGEGDEAFATSGQVVGWLTKPIAATQLYALVEKALKTPEEA